MKLKKEMRAVKEINEQARMESKVKEEDKDKDNNKERKTDIISSPTSIILDDKIRNPKP